MTTVRLLLANDLRRLARSPALAVALVAYPLVLALLVGLLVRYAGERPRVALVDRGALPRSLVLGERRFDLRRLLEDAAEVELVRMGEERAERELETGKLVAMLVVPADFSQRLRGLRASPQLVLRTTEGGLSTRVVEKIRALVYSINLRLQQAYIEANLGYVDLLLRGGTGKIGDQTLTVLGLRRAERELRGLARSRDPYVAARSRELAEFVDQVEGAVGQVGEFLRATANPIELRREARAGRTWILSAQVQAWSLALTLAFVTTLLGAAAVTWERGEQVLGRLVRGLVGLGELLVEKTVLAALVGAALGLVLALAVGLVVELGGVSGGEPWQRLPLLAAGLVVAGVAFGAFGVAAGTAAREPAAATLVSFMLALPAALLGAAPLPGLAPAGDLFPFGHAVDLFTAALYDPEPAGTLAREAAWLAALAAAYWLAARGLVRRLAS